MHFILPKTWPVLLVVITAPLTCLSDSAAADRPNVIVIMTDDQGFGDLSCHGNPIVSTPNLDALARQSVRLTDFHVAPMCTPTRGQLLSGLDAFRNGAMNVSSGRTLLRPNLKTLADVFTVAGYHTGIFGKWHLGDNYPFRPSDRGFSETLWFPSSHINSTPDYWDNDYFDDTYIRNGRRQRYSGYCTDIFFAEAMKWLSQLDQNHPFFLYLPLNAPHWPHFVPAPYRQQVERAMSDHEDIIAHLNKARRKELTSFLGMITDIDDNIGKLDAFLHQQHLYDNTIVVFLTDNGSTMGEDYFNAGMRGRKTQLWEGGHRVPCFIRWPKGEIAPQDIAGLCQVQDLMPTLAELTQCDVHLPEKLDGISLARAIRGESDIPDRMLVINYSRMPTFRESYTSTPHLPAREGAAVLWGKWRLLEDQRLYNLQDDPHQDHDVAANHPEVVQRMRAHLDSWWEGVKDMVMEPQRVVIGNERDNPTMLSACEWLDVFVDQQVQVRRGVRKVGTWYLRVDQPGRYIFELRRWPRESGLKLTDGVPPTPVTDGTYVAGEALPIHSAEIKIGDQVFSGKSTDEHSIRFPVALDAGPTELTTWLRDEREQPICGAYYVYVEMISPSK